jgi:hypothetical protein
MEAAAAGEAEDRLGDAAAGTLDPALRVLQIIGIEDDECAGTGRDSVGPGEAAGQAAVVELAVVRAVVLEGPAEGLAVEVPRAGDVGDGEFHIVDAAIVARLGHGDPLSCCELRVSDSNEAQTRSIEGLHILALGPGSRSLSLARPG